jgi:hypothetical protein
MILNILASSKIEIKFNHIPSVHEYRVLTERTTQEAYQLLGQLRHGYETREACRIAVEADTPGHVRGFIRRFCQQWGAREETWWQDHSSVDRLVEWLTDAVWEH